MRVKLIGGLILVENQSIFSFIHIHTKHVLGHEKTGNNQEVEITSKYT